MLSFNDDRWQNLRGGYRVPFDPRSCLSMLEVGKETKAAWKELWNELHHQGDVGEASYAAVPHLVRIYRSHAEADWNTYAIIAVIELARDFKQNPALPEWLHDDYYRAIGELAERGARDILATKDSETVRAILSVLAIAAGCRVHGRFILEYSDDELLEMERPLSDGDL